jgi:hypothetical protein
MSKKIILFASGTCAGLIQEEKNKEVVCTACYAIYLRF